MDPEGEASSSELQGLVAQAQEYAEYAKGAAYGSPYVAATVAAMTDKNKVYVYTGSEAGYTAGNWYYWNGSAWTSGGTYNSVAVATDKTLSVTDMAADAKATGDAIADLKSDISLDSVAVSYSTTTTYSLGFRSGYFGPQAGASSSSGSYCRTIAALNATKPYITIECPVKVCIVVFDTASPSYSNGADNSAHFKWSYTVPIGGTYTFENKSGEYYFLTLYTSYSTLTSSKIPTVKEWTTIGAAINALKGRDAELSTDIRLLGDTVDGKLSDVTDGYGLLYNAQTITGDDLLEGKYDVALDGNGNPVASLVVSSNYHSTAMFPCPKGGKLKIIGSDAVLGTVTFFDVENDLTSVQWQNLSSYNHNGDYEIDAYGNYFSISQNSASINIPAIYYKCGDGFNAVTLFPSDEKTLYDSVLADVDSNTIVFSCVADTHYNEGMARGYNQRKLASDFIRISENIGVDFALHLGDMYDEGNYFFSNTVYANERHAKEMGYRYKSSYIPFVYTQGHHELYPLVTSGDGSNTWTFSRERCIGILGRHMDGINAVHHDSSSSFYFDVVLPKVRFIVLDSCSYGANGFSSAVVSWYREVLSTVPSGYGVVVASHCAVVEYGEIPVSNGDAIKAATLDYIDGGGVVLCHLHGHYHRDNFNVISDGVNQYPLVSQGCQAVETKTTSMTGMDNFDATADRTPGTLTEYLFDIYCIHRDTKTVKTFRFGAGNNKTIITL